MATQPNAQYDPRTGQLTYADGTVVNPSAPVQPTVSPYAQDQVVGTIGCCTRVYSWTVPNAVILEAFREGTSPVDAHHDPRITFRLNGKDVPAPAEWSTVHIMQAAAKLVGWGLIPHSPFQRWHVAEHMQTPAFAEWVALHPFPSDVPTGNVDSVKGWVNAVTAEARQARAQVALDLELTKDIEVQRSTLITFLEGVLSEGDA